MVILLSLLSWIWEHIFLFHEKVLYSMRIWYHDIIMILLLRTLTYRGKYLKHVNNRIYARLSANSDIYVEISFRVQTPTDYDPTHNFKDRRCIAISCLSIQLGVGVLRRLRHRRCKCTAPILTGSYKNCEGAVNSVESRSAVCWRFNQNQCIHLFVFCFVDIVLITIIVYCILQIRYPMQRIEVPIQYRSKCKQDLYLVILILRL